MQHLEVPYHSQRTILNQYKEKKEEKKSKQIERAAFKRIRTTQQQFSRKIEASIS